VTDRRSPWFASYAPVFGLLVLGVVLRLAGASAHWQWFDREHPSLWETSKLELSQDANQYIQQADPHTWASPLHWKWTNRTYFRPPLASYYFVGLFRAVRFDRMLAASVQAGLAALAYLLLFLSARRVFGRGIALGTLAVVALHPVLMFYDVSFEDSTLALALLSATIYGALWARDGRAARWLVPGTAAGLAILARPNLLVVAAGMMVLAAAWSTKPRARVLGVLLVAYVGLMTPVLWHNYSRSGRVVPVADSAGQNLYWGNGPLSDYRVTIQGYWNIREVDRGSPADLLTEGLKDRTGKQFAEDAYRSAALDFMAEHPASALGHLLTKAWRHLSTYEIPRNTDFEILRNSVLVWRFPFAPFAAILVLAFVGLHGFDRRLGWLFLLPWLAAVFSEVLFFNASRYRAICIPFLVPLALRGLLLGFQVVRERRWRALAAGGLVVVFAIAAGALAVPASERARYAAVDRFKAAMLQSYADEDGVWLRISDPQFMADLGASLRLDPDNLDAFTVAQKHLIGEGKADQSFAEVAERERRCHGDDWLCHAACDYLRMAMGR
jgi:4-amino-4-deoxy-L-arabinose transferase-like glycosyltransferase